MAKENVYDEVLDRVLARVDKVAGSLSLKFKNVKPFQKEEIPKRALLQQYSSLTPDDMQWLITEHGEEKVNDFIFDMEMEKAKGVKRWLRTEE